jgi:hypothetical protein
MNALAATTLQSRSATLYGCLVGRIWWPSEEDATLPITVDLRAEARRYVNAHGSGLVDAIRATVDGAGDFRCARLTAESFVLIEHRDDDYSSGRSGRIRYRARRVDVADLPSLAEYVAVTP